MAATINLDGAVWAINYKIADICERLPLATTPHAKAKLTTEVMSMAKSLASIMAEIRKAGEEVEKSLQDLTPDRMAELVLKLIQRLSPDHLKAARLFIDELLVQP